MSATRGLIADVIRFSAVDGPGNRFVVFLQGCDFNCLACHNPHTIPAGSRAARWRTVPELVAQVRATAPFLSGVTVSGGEATRQSEFLRDFFAALHENEQLARLTRYVDSNGDAPRSVWDTLLPVLDKAMIDLKALDPDLHIRLTGRPNDHVLHSIRHLAAHGKLHEVRLLLIPGVNDDDRTLTATAAWLRDVDAGIRVKVIGFRQHGVRAAGRRWPEATPEQVAGWADTLSAAGLTGIDAI
ncbi:radical SAM protein [Dactylosporangium sp. AC04546]|uniref:radical SAM protein n=1 Tax=Dactylosporangium sp. AC04546 TaxID=2862460 RepID=UPI001EE010F6|nr:radical SAM protein [Dactylosporangium sp. AC04546]WVK84211.1 radical SAM protein [Dactylosporangium sp. AC04546]